MLCRHIDINCKATNFYTVVCHTMIKFLFCCMLRFAGLVLCHGSTFTAGVLKQIVKTTIFDTVVCNMIITFVFLAMFATLIVCY